MFRNATQNSLVILDPNTKQYCSSASALSINFPGHCLDLEIHSVAKIVFFLFKHRKPKRTFSAGKSFLTGTARDWFKLIITSENHNANVMWLPYFL